MGNNNVKKKILNHECPICYKNLNNKKIILECGHSFNYYCIQKHCITKYFKNIYPVCPLCNKIIKYKKIKTIFNKIYCLSNDPDEWYRKDIIHPSKISKIKYQTFCFKDLTVLNFSKFDPYLQNNILYLYSPTLKSFEISKNYLFDTLFYKSNINNFNSTPEFIFTIDCYYRERYIHWKRFIIKIIKLLNKKYDTKPLSDELNHKNKITFHIQNLSLINYSNENTGTFKMGLDLEDHFNCTKFKIQFQPLIYIINNKCHIINKITGFNAL